MHSNHLLLEEPIRMASILEPSKAVSIHESSLEACVHNDEFNRGSVISLLNLMEFGLGLICRVFFPQ